MDRNDWIQTEFNALRVELLSLAQAERAAVKFYMPAAGVVYAAPYFLIRDQVTGPAALREATFLWILCSTLAGLLTLAMIQSMQWSIDGARRIGMYIRARIEPQTHGGMRWETLLFELHHHQRRWPSDSLTIGISAAAANVVAAVAAGLLFLRGVERIGPCIAASVFTIAALPSLYRIATASTQRQNYAARIATSIEKVENETSSAPGQEKVLAADVVDSATVRPVPPTERQIPIAREPSTKETAG